MNESDQRQLLDNLTSVQARCTELLEILREYRPLIAAVERARAQYPQGSDWDALEREMMEAGDADTGSPHEQLELLDVACVALRLAFGEWTPAYAALVAQARESRRKRREAMAEAPATE